MKEFVYKPYDGKSPATTHTEEYMRHNFEHSLRDFDWINGITLQDFLNTAEVKDRFDTARYSLTRIF
jgi:hypothetical protein